MSRATFGPGRGSTRKLRQILQRQLTACSIRSFALATASFLKESDSDTEATLLEGPTPNIPNPHVTVSADSYHNALLDVPIGRPIREGIETRHVSPMMIS